MRDDGGSAPAEFAMVAGLLVMLLLAVIQFTVVLLVRNTVQDAAAQGARVAAFADGALDDGIARTTQLIDASLGPRYAQRIGAHYVTEGSLRVVEVRVSTSLPVIGLIGFAGAIEVTGHAALATE